MRFIAIIIILTLAVSACVEGTNNRLINKQKSKLSSNDSIKTFLKNKCKLYSRSKDFDSAYYYAEKLENYALNIRDTSLLIESYYRLGYYSGKKLDPNLAIQNYDKGISLPCNDSIIPFKLNLLANKISHLITLGDYKVAQNSAVLGIKEAKKIPDSSLVSVFYNKLAIAFSENNEIDNSLVAYYKAVAYNTSIIEKLKIKNNIGVSHKNQGDYRKAIKVYDSILRHPVLINFPLFKSQVQSNLGFSQFKINENSKAYKNLTQALEIRKKFKDWNGLFATNIHLANFYSNNNTQKSNYHNNEALQIAYNKTKSKESVHEALKLLILRNAATHEQTQDYLYLDDSLSFAKQKAINDYTAIKFQAKERDEELSISKQKFTNAQLKLAQEEKQKYILYTFLLLLILGAITSYFIIKQRYQIQTLKAREQERNRLSGNMHDTVAAKVREAMNIVDNIDKKNSLIKKSRINNKLEEVYEAIRMLSNDYKFLNFDRYAFPQQIQNLLEEREELYQFNIDAIGLGDFNWKKTPTIIKTEIYRSLQEALLNCYKHAKPKSVQIIFKKITGQIIVIVKDDGLGCDISSIKENVGLTDMRRRIKVLKGSLAFKKNSERGMSLCLGFPLNKKSTNS